MARSFAAVAVLAMLAVAAVAAGAPARPAESASGCPLDDPRAVTSSRPGADAQLVPGGAVVLHVCDYSGFTEPPPLPNQGPAHRLIGDGGVTDSSRVARIAAELNALPPPNNTIHCPADFGNQLIAYFRYPSGLENPVAIGLSGCQAITNGHVNRLGLDAPVVNELAALARPATISGREQVCGGPAPGGCRTTEFTFCGPSPKSCYRPDRVAIFTATGRHMATLRLHHARFSLEVPAGRYKLELLGDGKRIHGRVVETAHARARSGHTAHIVFTIAVP